MSIPAGWYPDPAGSSSQRWWDGQRWTDRLAAPAAAYGQTQYIQAPVLRAPEGTSPQTLWVWLIVVLPIASLIPLFSIDFGSVYATAMQGALVGDPGAAFAIYAQPGYLATLAVSLVVMVLTIVFAYLDWRALERRGVQRPFHWAFIFLVLAVGTLPYLIGRDVVARRRTGRWSGAAWIAIALTLVAVIALIAYLVVQVQSIVALMQYR